MKLFALLACAPDRPARFLVVDGREGDYALVEEPIPELVDPGRMTGTLGDGRVGGYLAGDLQDPCLADVHYSGGGAVHLRYSVRDGVGVPHDDDGVVLWSYYHTLSRVRAELEALDIEVAPIFPIDFAYQPSVGGIGLSTTNAAYVGNGIHLFVLLADRLYADLPLGANPGVIRHELGHALFQLIVAGSPFDEGPGAERYDVRALNEGFADLLAALTLDDPRFIDPSLVLEARHLDGDATLADAAPVDVDPYSRGTVYASLAWDLRDRTDPDTALVHAVAALERWGDEERWREGQSGVDTWATLLVEEVATERPDVVPGLCDDLQRRFATTPPVCE